jgi:hypothetical protein
MPWLLITLGMLFPAVAAPPDGPPPGPMGGERRPHPPPAWVSVGERSVWLGSGSYCWMRGRAGICVDGSLPRRPLLRVAPGDRLRFHFGFDPRVVHLSAPGVQTRLPRARVTTWVVPRTRSGPVSLLVRARRGGDASYGGTLLVEP